MEEERKSVFDRLGPINKTSENDNLSIEELKERSNRFKMERSSNIHDLPTKRPRLEEERKEFNDNFKQKTSSKPIILNENGSDEGEILDDDDDEVTFNQVDDVKKKNNIEEIKDECFSDWSDDVCDQLIGADEPLEEKPADNLETISDSEDDLDQDGSNVIKRAQPSILDILNIDWESFIAASNTDSLKSKLKIGEDQNDKIENTEKFRKAHSSISMLMRTNFLDKLAGDALSKRIYERFQSQTVEDYISVANKTKSQQEEFLNAQQMNGLSDRNFMQFIQKKYV